MVHFIRACANGAHAPATPLDLPGWARHLPIYLGRGTFVRAAKARTPHAGKIGVVTMAIPLAGNPNGRVVPSTVHWRPRNSRRRRTTVSFIICHGTEGAAAFIGLPRDAIQGHLCFGCSVPFCGRDMSEPYVSIRKCASFGFLARPFIGSRSIGQAENAIMRSISARSLM